MSAATYSRNPVVNRAISGADTVNLQCYAICTYSCGSIPTLDASSNTTVVAANYGQAFPQGQVATRHFGPGQTIPATFTTPAICITTGGSFQSLNFTWTLLSGIELKNG